MQHFLLKRSRLPQVRVHDLIAAVAVGRTNLSAMEHPEVRSDAAFVVMMSVAGSEIGSNFDVCHFAVLLLTSHLRMHWHLCPVTESRD